MSDDDLIKQLIIWADSGHVGNVTPLVRRAARRIAELTSPPPPNSIPVRIAVVMAVGALGVGWLEDDVTEEDAFRWARAEVDPCPIIGEAIIVANIPHRQIPEVTGTVEEVAT